MIDKIGEEIFVTSSYEDKIAGKATLLLFSVNYEPCGVAAGMYPAAVIKMPNGQVRVVRAERIILPV